MCVCVHARACVCGKTVSDVKDEKCCCEVFYTRCWLQHFRQHFSLCLPHTIRSPAISRHFSVLSVLFPAPSPPHFQSPLQTSSPYAILLILISALFLSLSPSLACFLSHTHTLSIHHTLWFSWHRMQPPVSLGWMWGVIHLTPVRAG